MTAAHKINSSELWTDLCFVSGEFGILISAAMSVAILLPRNMYHESLPSKGNFAPMAPYNPKPKHATTSPEQWFDMGDRLNVDRSVMASGVPAQAFEMPFKRHTALPRAIQQYQSPLDALPE